MRSPLRIAWALALSGLSGCDEAAAPEHPTPATCACRIDLRTGAAGQAFSCQAESMPEGAALCQRGQNDIYCAPPGANPNTFTGDVSCDPGFCVGRQDGGCTTACDCTATPPPD